MGKKFTKKRRFDDFYNKYARAIIWLSVLFCFPFGIIFTFIFLIASELVLTIPKLILFTFLGGFAITFVLYAIVLTVLISYDFTRPSQTVNKIIEETKPANNNE